jgi:RND family efflux transporter MFP subunit
MGCCLLSAGLSYHCAGGPAPSGGASGKPDPAERPLKVKAVTVTARDWDISVPVSGSLRSQSNVEVRAEVGGRLLAMQFEEGAEVARGRLLAEIDPANYRLAADQSKAAVAVAEAALARAQVLLAHSRREKERADNLLRTGGITEKDHQAAVTGVEDAQSQVKLAEAQCGQARAALSIAEKALGDCRIVAPADGQVRVKYLDPGALVSPGAAIYSLVDNSRLELECSVPSYQIADLRSGLRTRFTTPTWGERRFEGSVTAINPMVDVTNRSVKVVVKISNPRGELRSGMYARGEIEVRVERNALTVPRSALVTGEQEPGSGTVYVVADGRACARRVRVNGYRQDQMWIGEGLKPGDRVIVEIGPSLKDGSPVEVSADRAATEP